jgi:hypothetical protein
VQREVVHGRAHQGRNPVQSEAEASCAGRAAGIAPTRGNPSNGRSYRVGGERQGWPETDNSRSQARAQLRSLAADHARRGLAHCFAHCFAHRIVQHGMDTATASVGGSGIRRDRPETPANAALLQRSPSPTHTGTHTAPPSCTGNAPLPGRRRAQACSTHAASGQRAGERSATPANSAENPCQGRAPGGDPHPIRGEGKVAPGLAWVSAALHRPPNPASLTQFFGAAECLT